MDASGGSVFCNLLGAVQSKREENEMASKKNKPKYLKIDIDLTKGPLSLYASPRVLTALDEVTTELTLYKGVRLAEVLSAVYEQGLKDGRKDVVDQFQSLTKTMKYLPPGRPSKAKPKK